MPDAEDPLPPVYARRMRLFGDAVNPRCTDPPRHEAWCPHQDTADPMVAWSVSDGCSGRMCGPCDAQYQVKRWPDLIERIAGPARGLDALAALRTGISPGRSES